MLSARSYVNRDITSLRFLVPPLWVAVADIVSDPCLSNGRKGIFSRGNSSHRKMSFLGRMVISTYHSYLCGVSGFLIKTDMRNG